MQRTSTHIIKYANKEKEKYLHSLVEDYREAIKECINLIVEGKIPLQKYLSATEYSFGKITHSVWKQVIYKNASEMLRKCYQKNEDIRYRRYKKVYSYFKSKNRMVKFTEKRYSELTLRRKFYVKPPLKDVSINLDSRLVDFKAGESFDLFLRIKLPYFYKRKTKLFAIQICVPVKEHRVSLKYKDWERAKTVQLKEVNGNLYITFTYKKDAPNLKKEGVELGIDLGYHKLLSLSDGRTLGFFEKIYKNIIKKKQGSKNCKDLIQHKNNLVRKCLNDIGLENVKVIYMENLKGMKTSKLNKKNKKTRKSFRKISNYIPYTVVKWLLERKCEEQGVRLVEVPPQYTSQTCSRCGTVKRSNRNGESYRCSSCGLEIDADINAAINIYNRGKCNSLNTGK